MELSITGFRWQSKTHNLTTITPSNLDCIRLNFWLKYGEHILCILSKLLIKLIRLWSTLRKVYLSHLKLWDFPYFKSCSISLISLQQKKILMPQFCIKNWHFYLCKTTSKKLWGNLYYQTLNKFSESLVPFQCKFFYNLS